MDTSQDRYFILVRKVSSFLGIWPTQPYNERLPRTCIVSFVLLDLVLAQLYQILTLDFNMMSIVLVQQMLIPCLCTASVYCAFILQSISIQSAFFYLINDWQQVEDETEVKITQKYINQSKLFTNIYGSIFYTFAFISIFPFILRIIVFTNEVRYNTDRYPVFSCFYYFLGQERYYYSLIIYQMIMIVLMVTVAMTCFSIYFWSIQHVCARLCITQFKICQPSRINQYNNNIVKKPIDFSDWIIDIIQYNSRTKRLMTILNKVGEKCYLFQTFMSLFQIVINILCLFQVPLLMQQKETRKDAFAFLFFITDTTFAIYVNYYIGQRVINYSNDAYKEMCLMPFYEMSVKTQKLLLTLITMNAKPCAISIGKMFLSSHEHFSNLLQMSLSFALVLQSTEQI